MKQNKFDCPISALPVETFIERLQYAMSLLYTHGYLSAGGRDRVVIRIQKARAKEGKGL